MLGGLSEKNREILERRFGVGTDAPETLESIGRSYNITRERVRQIQEYGLRRLNSHDALEVLSPIFTAVKSFIESNSGVVKDEDLFENIATDSNRAHLALALRLMPNLVHAQETNDFYARYALYRERLLISERFLENIHAKLSRHGSPMKLKELFALAQDNAPQESLRNKTAIEQVLRVSRRVKEGPLGDYGLAEWPAIRPRGVRDKAHLVFEREGKPLHFKELSSLIDDYFQATFVSRKTHPQTVHNELIKDPRFVLIGRGLYALAEWGYEAGTVKDVLVKILKENNGGLSKEDVLELIAQKRFVKPNTIFLNLQNKNYFKKLEDGKYYLA